MFKKLLFTLFSYSWAAAYGWFAVPFIYSLFEWSYPLGWAFWVVSVVIVSVPGILTERVAA